MSLYYLEYETIALLVFTSLCLGAVLLAVSFGASKRRTLDFEKLSAYECGFDPFEDCRAEFNIHFYLLGILFVVFDLEVILLLPWVVSVGSLDKFSILVSLDFLVELAIGYAYV